MSIFRQVTQLSPFSPLALLFQTPWPAEDLKLRNKHSLSHSMSQHMTPEPVAAVDSLERKVHGSQDQRFQPPVGASLLSKHQWRNANALTFRDSVRPQQCAGEGRTVNLTLWQHFVRLRDPDDTLSNHWPEIFHLFESKVFQFKLQTHTHTF